MPFLRSGRNDYYVKVPTKEGRWVTRSTGTPDGPTAKSMERMIHELLDRRDWPTLGLCIAVGDRYPLAQVWDAWRTGRLDDLHAAADDLELGPLIGRWIRNISHPATAARYETQVRSLVPGRVATVSALTPEAVDAWLADTVGGTGSTRARYFAALSSFVKYLVSIRVLRTNPLTGLRRPKSNPARCRALSLEDARRVVGASRGEFRTLFALAYGAGAELGAAVKVTRGDVNLKTKEVRLRGSKSEWRDRVVRVADWAWLHIDLACADKLPAAPLFTDRPLWQWSNEHARIIKELKLGDYTLHDARHHWAVRMAKVGMPAEMIARQLGHRDATMVIKVYGRFMPAREERDRWEKLAQEREAQG